MAKEQWKFRDVFEEDSNKEYLTLLFDVEVEGQVFKKGDRFNEKEKLGGFPFHDYRYLDLAVETENDFPLKIVGFYPAD